MHESHAVTILARRFPAKRAFITGAGSGLGRAFAAELAAAGWQLGLLDLSADRLAAVEAELGGADASVSCYAGDAVNEWPREYRWAWRLKRFFPLWFLRRLETLRDAQLARSSPQPR